jgi:hypothetical protein
MIHRRLALFTASLLLVAILAPEVVRAQAAPAGRIPISIRKVEMEQLETPLFSVRGPNQQTPREKWVRIFAEFDAEPEWTDDLTFNFYLGVRGKAETAPPLSLFKGAVTYVNVPQGRRHMAEVFVHPVMLERFGEPGPVALEVRQGGRLIAQTGKPEPSTPWWNDPRAIPQEGALLDRGRSPYALLDLETQLMIKAP